MALMSGTTLGEPVLEETSPPPPPSSPIFAPDALPAATLPIYPGLGQSPNMLACIPNGLVCTESLGWHRYDMKISLSPYVYF